MTRRWSSWDELRRQPEPADDVAVELQHQARRGENKK
jgi:hypothetical protein